MHAPAIPTPTSRRAQEPILRSILKPSSWPFLGVHLAALLVFFVPFSWSYVAVGAALYFVRMFGITGGYHRYFSHRTFKTSRVFQFVLAWLGCIVGAEGAAVVGGAPPPSPQVQRRGSRPALAGAARASAGRTSAGSSRPTTRRRSIKRIPDMAKYPELLWLNRWHLVPGIALAVVLFLDRRRGAAGVGLLRQHRACWHCTFMINSLTHMFGTRRYATTDDSRNSLILALLTMGEGWHNNHHYYQSVHAPGLLLVGDRPDLLHAARPAGRRRRVGHQGTARARRRRARRSAPPRRASSRPPPYGTNR